MTKNKKQKWVLKKGDWMIEVSCVPYSIAYVKPDKLSVVGGKK